MHLLGPSEKKIVYKILFMKFIFLSLIVAVGCLSGCRGGKSISNKSTGINIISPSDLERQPNGTYKVKPAKVESAKSKPQSVNQSVKANPTSVSPNAKGSTPSWNREKHNLSSATPKVNVIPNTNNVSLPEKPENDNSNVVIEKGNPKVKVDWNSLWAYYLGCVIVGVIIWLCRKIYLDYKNNKKS